ESLVARGFVRANDLEKATAQLARFSGKLAESLVALGIMRPLDVFRLLSQHVRERVIELFTWTQGIFSLYRGRRNPAEAFPLGLDSFELLGAGVLTLSLDFLQARFGLLTEFRPRAATPPRVPVDSFRL